jgi:hypothetical protein
MYKTPLDFAFVAGLSVRCSTSVIITARILKSSDRCSGPTDRLDLKEVWMSGRLLLFPSRHLSDSSKQKPGLAELER